MLEIFKILGFCVAYIEPERAMVFEQRVEERKSYRIGMNTWCLKPNAQIIHHLCSKPSFFGCWAWDFIIFEWKQRTLFVVASPRFLYIQRCFNPSLRKNRISQSNLFIIEKNNSFESVYNRDIIQKGKYSTWLPILAAASAASNKDLLNPVIHSIKTISEQKRKLGYRLNRSEVYLQDDN